MDFPLSDYPQQVILVAISNLKAQEEEFSSERGAKLISIEVSLSKEERINQLEYAYWVLKENWERRKLSLIDKQRRLSREIVEEKFELLTKPTP